MSREPESIELPHDLVEGMRRVDRSVAVLTPAVDRRVADAAAAHFRHRRTHLPRPARRWATAGTLAAGVALAAVLVRIQTGIEPVLTANDFDGSGVVDILDAFALARANPGPPGPAQARIDALIMDIVAIGGSSP